MYFTRYLKLPAEKMCLGLSMLGLLFIFLMISPAHAQVSPELMVTWRADNYVPSEYRGKALPVAGTVIKMSVELIDNGKFVDISEKEIRWLINNESLQSGIGLKNISVKTERFRSSQKIRVTVVDHNESNINKFVTIPVVEPETVIRILKPDIAAPGLYNFEALLYFFNVTDISRIALSWSANGQVTEGDTISSGRLELDVSGVPSGTRINLELKAENIDNPRELVRESTSIRI